MVDVVEKLVDLLRTFVLSADIYKWSNWPMRGLILVSVAYTFYRLVRFERIVKVGTSRTVHMFYTYRADAAF